jgi:hypothetical protein
MLALVSAVLPFASAAGVKPTMWTRVLGANAGVPLEARGRVLEHLVVLGGVRVVSSAGTWFGVIDLGVPSFGPLSVIAAGPLGSDILRCF